MRALWTLRRTPSAMVLVFVVSVVLSGCQWHGLNSIPLPGTAGGGDGSYSISVQLRDVGTMQPNTRVRVDDVDVGTVTKIERQGWHALLTVRLGRDVRLPANVTAKVGQTSLLGSVHLELAPPANEPPEGTLVAGAVIPLKSTGAAPTTEQTLAAASMLLNGGGLGQIQDVTQAFSTAFAGREQDVRSLITQLDVFIAGLQAQSADIISATESLDSLAGQFAAADPTLDNALRTVPGALKVLADERTKLVDAIEGTGRFSAVVATSVRDTRQSLVKELNDIAPVVKSLADAGLSMTRALSLLSTYPYVKENVSNWIRGDYGNLTAVFDLTLSRLDNSLLTGTRFEGSLTRLEMQWGRTIGQLPSPYTNGNPLVVPYRMDQER